MTPQWILIGSLIIFGGTFAWRAFQIRSHGIDLARYGREDIGYKLIGPLSLIYFYHVVAIPLGLPNFAGKPIVAEEWIGWLGVVVAITGFGLVLWGLFSFKDSIRIGIDSVTPGKLITDGAFAVSRNPLYTGFNFYLLGQFLVYPAWFFLVFLVVASMMLYRQIRQEEAFLIVQHGEEYRSYLNRVRRYL